MLRKFTLEILLLIFFAMVCTIFLWVAMDYPTTPAQFPQLICTFTLIVSIVLLIVKLRPHAKVDPGKTAKPGPYGLPWFVFVGLMIAYVALMDLAGFVIATLLYLLGIPFLMGFRRRFNLVAIAVISTFLLFICMKYGLDIQVPAGRFWGD